MVEERYNYKAIKDYTKVLMAKEGYSQESIAKKLGYSQQNVNYALNEPNRFQYMILDILLEMDYEVTLTKNFIKVNKRVGA